MNGAAEQPRLWSNTQAYFLFVICLLLGLAAGYVLRPAPSPPPAAVQPPATTAPGASAQVTPDQLKHMADKKAEPLLAELKTNPNDAALLARIGETYLAAQQFQTAQDYFSRSLALKPDPAVLNRSASAIYFLGDADKAIATLQRALELAPNDATALFNLGMLQWRAKTDPKAAIATWERLLKAHPDDPNRAQIEELIARARMHLNIPPGTKTPKPAL